MPSCIMIRRLPYRMASRMLCVTIMAVSWCSEISRSESVSTFSAVRGSSAAVCSSSSSSCGFLSVAIRSVSACRCPPESRPTFALSRPSRPRSSALSASRYCSRSALVMPQPRPRFLPRRSAMARFSSMPMSAAVPIIGSWNTRPSRAARRCSGSRVSSVPSRQMEPQSAGNTPAMRLSSVLLPAPLPPMTVTKSPSANEMLTSRMAVFSLTVPL